VPMSSHLKISERHPLVEVVSARCFEYSIVWMTLFKSKTINSMLFWNTRVILAALDFLLLDQLPQLGDLPFAISIHPSVIADPCYFRVATVPE